MATRLPYTAHTNLLRMTCHSVSSSLCLGPLYPEMTLNTQGGANVIQWCYNHAKTGALSVKAYLHHAAHRWQAPDT